jgi:cytochrome c biogenesis protein CcmG/thiol:disulfide interchange protein DsbE
MDPITAFLADRRRWSLLLMGVIFLGCAGLRCSAMPVSETTGGLIPAPREGFLAPAFELETLAGGSSGLSEYRGQVIVLNLWASWCPPCRAEMPAIQSLYEQYREEGLAVLAINMTSQDSTEAAASFVGKYGLTFPVLLDRMGLVGNLYRMRALPMTFFIDREGVIREVIVGGPMSELTLQSMIARLLDAKG